MLWRMSVTKSGARGHGLFWLTGRVLPRCNFGAGLVELGFDVVGQLKLVFEIIVNPFADFFDFRARQLWNGCFYFFNRAHGD